MDYIAKNSKNHETDLGTIITNRTLNSETTQNNSFNNIQILNEDSKLSSKFTLKKEDLIKIIDAYRNRDENCCEDLNLLSNKIRDAYNLGAMLGVDITKGISKQEIKLRQQFYNSNPVVKKEKNLTLFSNIILSKKSFWILISLCILSYIVHLILFPNFNSLFNFDTRLITLSIGKIGYFIVVFLALVLISATRILEKFLKTKAKMNLKNLNNQTQLEILRDGKWKNKLVLPEDLVVGDIIKFGPFSNIPADSIIISSCDLKIDERLINSEMGIIKYDIKCCYDKYQEAIKRNIKLRRFFHPSPLLLSGSKIISGNCICIVIASGSNTWIHRNPGLLNNELLNTNFKSLYSNINVGDSSCFCFSQRQGYFIQSFSSYYVGGIIGLIINILFIGGYQSLIKICNYTNSAYPFFEIITFNFFLCLSFGFPSGLNIFRLNIYRKILQYLVGNRKIIVADKKSLENLANARNLLIKPTEILKVLKFKIHSIYTPENNLLFTLENYDLKKSETNKLSFNLSCIFKDSLLLNSFAIKNTGNPIDICINKVFEKVHLNSEIINANLNDYSFEIKDDPNDFKKRLIIIKSYKNNVDAVFIRDDAQIILNSCNYIFTSDGIRLLEEKEINKIQQILKTFQEKQIVPIGFGYKELEPPSNKSLEDTVKFSEIYNSNYNFKLVLIGIIFIEYNINKTMIDSIIEIHQGGISISKYNSDIEYQRYFNSVTQLGRKQSNFSPLNLLEEYFYKVVHSVKIEKQKRLNSLDFGSPDFNIFLSFKDQEDVNLINKFLKSLNHSVNNLNQNSLNNTDISQNCSIVQQANNNFTLINLRNNDLTFDAEFLAKLNLNIPICKNIPSLVNCISLSRNIYIHCKQAYQFLYLCFLIITFFNYNSFLDILSFQFKIIHLLYLINMTIFFFGFQFFSLTNSSPKNIEGKPFNIEKQKCDCGLLKHILTQYFYFAFIFTYLLVRGPSFIPEENILIKNIPLSFNGKIRDGRVACNFNDENQELFDSGIHCDYYPKKAEEILGPSRHFTIILAFNLLFLIFQQINCSKVEDELNIFKDFIKNKIAFLVLLIEITLIFTAIQYGGRLFDCSPFGLTWYHWLIVLGFVCPAFLLRIITIFLSKIPYSKICFWRNRT